MKRAFKYVSKSQSAILIKFEIIISRSTVSRNVSFGKYGSAEDFKLIKEEIIESRCQWIKIFNAFMILIAFKFKLKDQQWKREALEINQQII